MQLQAVHSCCEPYAVSFKARQRRCGDEKYSSALLLLLVSVRIPSGVKDLLLMISLWIFFVTQAHNVKKTST